MIIIIVFLADENGEDSFKDAIHYAWISTTKKKFHHNLCSYDYMNCRKRSSRKGRNKGGGSVKFCLSVFGGGCRVYGVGSCCCCCCSDGHEDDINDPDKFQTDVRAKTPTQNSEAYKKTYIGIFYL